MKPTRENLGKLVRRIWVQWAMEQPDVASHPNWTLPWEALSERDREVDRRIGERLYAEGLIPHSTEPKATCGTCHNYDWPHGNRCGVFLATMGAEESCSRWVERGRLRDELMPEPPVNMRTAPVSALLDTLGRRAEAARLWKRAAKAYREARREAMAPHTWSEADRLREECRRLQGELSAANHDRVKAWEERDAAHAALRTIAEHVGGRVSPECSHEFHLLVANEVRGVVGKLREERDAARDCQAGKQDWFCGRCQACLSRVNGELHNENKSLLREQNSARAGLARMRPVVQQACIAYDAGGLLGYSGPGVLSLRRAVEAYRAGGKENNMTPEQREAQRRSFVYGNTKMANDSVTPELVNDVANGKVEPEPSIPLPDIQRTYRAPDNDTAERIAADAASDHARPTDWVVRKRIEALVDNGIRGAMLRIAIACDIHEACGHVVDDIAEAIERLKRDRSLLAAITAEANAYRKHFRAAASAVGAHITEDEWEEMTPGTAERVAAEVDSAQPEPAEPPQPGAPERVWCRGVEDGEWRSWKVLGEETGVKYIRADLVETRVRAALEAAAERAVEWWSGTNSSTASLRRAVMGGEK